MKRFAIDANLLVYAHNTDSKFHKKAAAFIEKVMNERNEEASTTLTFISISSNHLDSFSRGFQTKLLYSSQYLVWC